MLKATFKDGTVLFLTEILNTRATGKTAAGEYEDRHVKDIVRFEGRIVFYESILGKEEFVETGKRPVPVVELTGDGTGEALPPLEQEAGELLSYNGSDNPASTDDIAELTAVYKPGKVEPVTTKRNKLDHNPQG